MKMITKSVRLAEHQVEALEREATRNKKSFNGLVREAVDELLALRFGKRMAAIAHH
jgi:predicted HicB family RNase H-like nuclease